MPVAYALAYGTTVLDPLGTLVAILIGGWMSGMFAPREKLLMVRASFGPTGKPSSASLIAGWNSFGQGSLPYF